MHEQLSQFILDAHFVQDARSKRTLIRFSYFILNKGESNKNMHSIHNRHWKNAT